MAVMWKAAQHFLTVHEGVDVGSPTQAVRASRRVALLTDEQAEAALGMGDDRNLIVHVHREAVARDLDSRLAAHAETMAAWLEGMRQRASASS